MMYMWLLKTFIEQNYGNYNYSANMLVVETVLQHRAMLYPVSKADLLQGFKEFGALIKRVAFHEIHGYENTMEVIISGGDVDFNEEL